MAPKTALIPLLLGLLILACSTTYLLWEDNMRVSQQLAESRKTLEAERDTHAAQIKAMTANARDRENINEASRERLEELGQALEQDALAAMPLPEHLRLRLQWRPDTAAPTAGRH